MSTSTPINLAEQLRDVHLPPEVGLWPLAPAWWILLAVLAALALLLLWFSQRRHARLAKNKYRVSAKQELELAYQCWCESGDDIVFLSTANSVLKRCCLHLQPGLAAGQQGEAWRNGLRALSPQTLSQDTELAITTKLYQVAPQVDVEQIYPEVVTWLDRHSLDLLQKNQQAEQAEQGASNATHGDLHA